MTYCIFMSIDYDDKYKACEVSGPDDFKQRFATGDPVADFAAMRACAMQKVYETDRPVMSTSSFEGFLWDTQDGKRYRFDEDDILILADDAPAGVG